MNDNNYNDHTVWALSKQSIKALRVIVSENRMMSAYQLAQLLGVNQQHVYRIVEPLIERRLIRSGSIINKVYAPQARAHARNAYVRYATAEFERLFGDVYDAKTNAKTSK